MSRMGFILNLGGLKCVYVFRPDSSCIYEFLVFLVVSMAIEVSTSRCAQTCWRSCPDRPLHAALRASASNSEIRDLCAKISITVSGGKNKPAFWYSFRYIG